MAQVCSLFVLDRFVTDRFVTDRFVTDRFGGYNDLAYYNFGVLQLGCLINSKNRFSLIY
jgi:hypothetical protein